MTPEDRKAIIELINREVVPAIGCTEPIAVSLCVSKAVETLGAPPSRIEAKLSANIIKNAMGVGIPGTGMIGLPIAIALGAIIGKSEYGLEVLKECNPQAVERAKAMVEQNAIDIKLKENITEKLYIEITAHKGEESATSIISGGHTNFVSITRNGESLLSSGSASIEDGAAKGVELSMAKVYEFATTAPLEEIEFIMEAQRLNNGAAEASFKENYGHQLGRIMRESSKEEQILGKNTFSKILSFTTAACDARMAGAMIPVMSNSGSGNQGITATLPVTVYAQENGKSHEELVRALILSHLTVIYIKQSLGRLSALCGCVVAATGSSCGITHLMGGDFKQICFAVQNMIATLTGMVCDGAKPSCALKLASGVSTAILSSILAMENKCVSAVEGIIDSNVDKSIRNLTRIGSDSMNETDRTVLDIMTHKGC